jgi:hypothetical protein
MFKEDGICYTRDREEAIDLDMKEFSYDCTYNISENEKTTVRNSVYCYNKKDLLSLTNHWNIVENTHKERMVYFYTIPYMEFGKEIEWNGL